jgi:hypothetical protein
VSENVYVTLH